MKKKKNSVNFYFSSIVWDRMSFTKKVCTFYSMTDEERYYFEQELNKKCPSMAYWSEHNFYNLRHVVFELCRDKSLTPKQFAREINVTEDKINNLIQYGECNAALLNEIADYFKVPIKGEFKNYTANSIE